MHMNARAKAFAAAAVAALGAAVALKAYLAKRARDAEDDAAMAILGARNGRMHSDASVAHGRTFSPGPTDVFIVTYPKCGTTWVSAMCHFLRSDDDSFGEITEVVPWDVVALDCGQDLDGAQAASPRLYKSHEAADAIAKGGRYVYVARDPRDAFVSFYNFLPAYMHAGRLSVERFAVAIFGGLSHSGGIWAHFVGWWERRNDEDVLFLTYEDVKSDPRAAIAEIAAFMGVSADAATVDRVYARTTLAAMSRDGTKYDDHFVFDKLKAQMGFPEGATHQTSKVRTGRVGSSRSLPAAVLAMLDARWRDTVSAATGLATYADLRRAL